MSPELAPENPRDLLTAINAWQREHEGRPASPQQTAMTTLYSAIRDLLPIRAGEYRPVQVDSLRAALEAAFPDLQQQVYEANGAEHAPLDPSGPPHRWSCRDPRYNPATGSRLAIFLDGVGQRKVIAYDVALGKILRFAVGADGKHIRHPVTNAVVEETVRGTVTVKWRERG
jgi:hypothetical protein